MNTQAKAVSETSVESQASAATVSVTRPMFWSVHRELWENHAIFIGPVAVAGVILFGFLIGAIRVLPHMREALLNPAYQRQAVQIPYDGSAAILMATAFIVGVFYCLDALYGERRDRSVLFWKSLPVSDRTAVLAKATVPLVVLPLVTFVVMVCTHLVILLLSMMILPGKGVSAAVIWSQLPLFRLWVAVLYGLAAIALWHAPIYGWLLLVSAWARRATFLWAVLPPFAIGVLEKISLNTLYFRDFLKYRLFGWFPLAFIPQPEGSPPVADPLSALTPGKLLSAPGLWLGLVAAAIFLFAAMRLRRYQGPI